MERFQEFRSLQFEEMVARAETSDDVIKIAGYGAVFNRWYDVWGFRERIAPGAFAKTLKESPDIRGMFNHDPNFLLGRTKAGTMDVSEDGKGLRYEIRADAADPQAQSIGRKIARGDVDGSSMAFFVHAEEWEKSSDDKPDKRTITEIELIETGPVTMPASPSTSAKIRRAQELSGIDYDAIAGLIVKNRAGFRLTEAESDLVKRTIEALEHLKSEPDHDEHHSDTGTAWSPITAQKYRAAALGLRKRLIATL